MIEAKPLSRSFSYNGVNFQIPIRECRRKR
jgi:hypothetical protein